MHLEIWRLGAKLNYAHEVLRFFMDKDFGEDKASGFNQFHLLVFWLWALFGMDYSVRRKKMEVFVFVFLNVAFNTWATERRVGQCPLFLISAAWLSYLEGKSGAGSKMSCFPRQMVWGWGHKQFCLRPGRHRETLPAWEHQGRVMLWCTVSRMTLARSWTSKILMRSMGECGGESLVETKAKRITSWMSCWTSGFFGLISLNSCPNLSLSRRKEISRKIQEERVFL